MLLKVSSKTEPGRLAGVIIRTMSEFGGPVKLQAIGAGAVNQAVKAIAVAQRILNERSGRKVKAVPGFVDIDLQGRQVTAIRFNVFAS